MDALPVRAGPAAIELLEPLVACRRPVHLAAQVVHSDLPGNVLFAAGKPPAVIDWAVYWRPASPDLAARWSHLPEWGQMLIRALIYRIVTHNTAFGPTGLRSTSPSGTPPTMANVRGHGAGKWPWTRRVAAWPRANPHC